MRYTAEELFAEKQPARIPDVVATLEAYGFITKPSNTAHIHYIHPECPEFSGTMARTKDSNHTGIRYQKMAAKNCIGVEAALAEKKQKLTAQFEQAGEDRLSAIRAQLPAHITAELTQDGLVVLRDVQIPQIGVTLYSPEEDRLIENKIHNEIEPMKRGIYIALNRLHTEYDAHAVFEDGSFTGQITHEVYETLPAFSITPYQADEGLGKVLAAIDAYKGVIEHKDIEHLLRKDAALAGHTVLVSHSAPRGERHNYVSVDLGERDILKVSFNTYSNQRVSGDGTKARISEAELEKLEAKMARAKDWSASKTKAPERHAA